MTWSKIRRLQRHDWLEWLGPCVLAASLTVVSAKDVSTGPARDQFIFGHPKEPALLRVSLARERVAVRGNQPDSRLFAAAQDSLDSVCPHLEGVCGSDGLSVVRRKNEDASGEAIRRWGLRPIVSADPMKYFESGTLP